MQRGGAGLATGGQQFLDIVHMRTRLMLFRKLFERDERGRQRFRDNPFVVAGNSLFRHELIPRSLIARKEIQSPSAGRSSYNHRRSRIVGGYFGLLRSKGKPIAARRD
jgi:hypothetical protein